MQTYAEPSDLYTAVDQPIPVLIDGLRAEDALKHDRIIAPRAARAENGFFVIEDDYLIPGDPLSPRVEGETYRRFTRLARQQLSDVLGIPWAYTQRMFDEDQVALYDHNVNTWLQTRSEPMLVRAISTDDGLVARAVLSNRYQAFDDVDVVAAALGGLHDSGMEIKVTGGDRTAARMRLRVQSPQIFADLTDILRNYTFRGRTGTQYPLAFAGLVISNSEVGLGAVNIVPEIRLQVCSNGLQVNVATGSRFRKIHFGAAISEAGVIQWSDETRSNVLRLVRSQIKDAAATFLSAEFLAESIAAFRDLAAINVPPAENGAPVVAQVAERLRFSNEERDAIFAEFLRGNDPSAFGVANAVAAHAHTVRLADPDRAFELEAAALRAGELVASIR